MAAFYDWAEGEVLGDQHRTVHNELGYIKRGSGTPEGSVTADVGSIFIRSDGGAGTIIYSKESGSGNTGWVAVAGVSGADHGILSGLTDNDHTIHPKVFNIKTYGAVSTAAAVSSATAIQNAVAAANAAGGGVVYIPEVPTGEYFLYDSNTALAPGSHVILQGAGADASRVRFTGTSAIKWPAASTMQSILDLTLETTNADLLVWPDANYASNISIERCHLISLSTTKRLIYNGAGGWSNFGYIGKTTLEASTNASVSPIEVSSSSNWNANLVEACVFQCNGGLLVPFVKLTNTNDAGYMYQNSFRDIWVENGIGGAIWVYSAWGCDIENVYSYDNTSAATDDFIHIDVDAGGQSSRYIRILNVGFNGTFTAGKFLIKVVNSYATIYDPDNQPISVGTDAVNIYGSRAANITGTPLNAIYETATGLVMSTDTNIYRGGANQLKTDDEFVININGGKDTLSLPDTTADVGITIGGDAVLYRAAANKLATDDALGLGGRVDEKVKAVGATGATETIALTVTDGTIQTFTVDANCVFTMPSGLTSGVGISFTVILTDSGGPRTIDFSGVKWSGGTNPTVMSGAGAVDIYTFLTIDGGTTWYGFTGGTGMAT